MTQAIAPINIQFGQKYEPEKARRLVEELRKLSDTVNSLIRDIQSLTVGTATGVSQHVLATSAGLGADHTVSGLVSGQVLKAMSGVTAAFGKLSFGEMAGIDETTFAAPTQGQALVFWDGYYSMRSLSIGGLSDPGADVFATWSASDGAMIWRSAGHGIDFGAGSVSVDETVLNHGLLGNLTSGNPHPQYPLKAATETISGAWTFSAAAVFNGFTTFNSDTYLSGETPKEYKTATDSSVDAGHWVWEYLDSEMRLKALDDVGDDLEVGLDILRDAFGLFDEWAFTGNRMTHNGNQVLTELDSPEIELRSYFLGGA